MTFSCGCPLDPQYPEQRCELHRDWPCHGKAAATLCPPCYRARLLSVSLSPSATPTRKLSRFLK